MKATDWFQVLAYLATLIVLTPLLGAFVHRVFSGERTFLSPVLGPVERLIYKLGGVDPEREMRWTNYTLALLAFNLLGFLSVLGLQLFQKALPLNPQNLDNVPFGLAFNTAASFMTNTNWQAYSGGNTLSYLSQMLGLAVQNFVSAATGIAVVIALARGLTRRSGQSLGNFWADLVRSTLYVLLPLSLVFAVVLVQQGVPQTVEPCSTVKTLEGADQVIPLGPAALQIAIKQLRTNGGGFYGQNSAHPLENPTPLTSFLEMLAILMISAALTYTYGLMAGDQGQGWTIFGAMMALFLSGFALSWWA
jgi:K+-transporting ATPase ATPase A chain